MKNGMSTDGTMRDENFKEILIIGKKLSGKAKVSNKKKTKSEIKIVEFPKWFHFLKLPFDFLTDVNDKNVRSFLIFFFSLQVTKKKKPRLIDSSINRIAD